MKLRFLLTCGAALMLAAELFGAEQFGSISVTPQSLASGETYHGYREYRILLENNSLKDSHEVTLIFPDRSYNYGNSIGRMSRTVVMAPNSRAVVPIWQPPLPQNGSSLLRVIVDGEEFSERVNISSVSHVNRSGSMSGGFSPPAVLVSRSLNYDDLSRVLKPDNTGFSAAMAVGRPDSRGRRGVTPSSWTPDSSSSGPHWIELDYAPAFKAERLRFYDTGGLASSSVDVVLTGVSGTNYSAVVLTAAGRFSGSHECSLPSISEPIKTVRLNFGSAYAGSISVDAVELIGTSGSAWATDARASSEMSAGSTTPGGESIRLLRAEMPVGDWSEAWLTYSPFDAVVLSANDLRTMPAAIQNALWRYTECGGNLVVFGGTSIPEPWRSLSKTAIEDGESVRPGFGECFVFKAEKVPQASTPGIDAVEKAVTDTARKWQSLPDENSANSTFQVVENVRIPVRGIVVIMLAFVVVIGPVNIIYLSRKNRRTWLLWTIPAISFVTSGIVFVYSFLHEGITSNVRIEGVTFLDQSNRRAATLGMTAFYCPLTPGGGLYFSSDTEATPLVETYNYRRGTEREVDWTQGQRLQRGWVNARVPAHFVLRKTETRRERIQFETAGAQASIVNGLGASIQSLWIADSSGKLYKAENVPAGKTAQLNRVPGVSVTNSRRGPQALIEGQGFSLLTQFDFTNAVSFLQPGSYIAELDGNPFLENGLGTKGKSARVKARSVVYGVLETTPQP